MASNLSEDIRPLADLKRNSRAVLAKMRRTGRPVILTVNGKANAVLMNTETYEKHLQAMNLGRLLAPAEEDIAAGRVRSMRSFLREFEDARKISS